MSANHDFQIKRWQCLIKEYQESGMKFKDWCAANDVTKYQYYYWLNKIRAECYEAVVKQLNTVEAGSSTDVPMPVKSNSFVEINPTIINEAAIQGSLRQPAAVLQKDNLRIEIMPSATASFIRQLVTAVQYA